MCSVMPAFGSLSDFSEARFASQRKSTSPHRGMAHMRRDLPHDNDYEPPAQADKGREHDLRKREADFMAAELMRSMQHFDHSLVKVTAMTTGRYPQFGRGGSTFGSPAQSARSPPSMPCLQICDAPDAIDQQQAMMRASSGGM
mmetsp:Transcript_42155/g.82484  ORF Transcript_42155/g.82484 Transcript_42155/m.82484 type:complete len:143 (+) Transcript_42155:154-582(+)